MALDKPRGGGQNRRPSLRGEVVQRLWRGKEVSQHWPRPKGKRLPEAQREQMEFFRQVQWAWKFTEPGFQRELTAAVANTPLLPRDLFLSAVSGRLAAWYQPDGTKITSVAAMNDVSETLDFLASETGAILIRTPEGWVGLSPGTANQVLTLTGDPLLPSWQDGGGGGGGTDALMPLPTPGQFLQSGGDNWGTTSSLILTDSHVTNPVTVARLKWPILSGSGNSKYRPLIYDWAPAGIVPDSTAGAVLIATGPQQQRSSRGIIDLPLDAPVNLPGGRIYLVGIHRIDATTQTSPLCLIQNRQTYYNTTIVPVPPDPLPALTEGQRQYMSMWSEAV